MLLHAPSVWESFGKLRINSALARRNVSRPLLAVGSWQCCSRARLSIAMTRTTGHIWVFGERGMHRAYVVSSGNRGSNYWWNERGHQI